MQTGNDVPKVGWIGTGVMGKWMCQHLIEGGYQAIVYNRTPQKAQALVDMGAILAETPAQVASQADVVFTMVGYPKDVRECYFGEAGIFSGVRPGTLLVDMTTTEPTLAMDINERALQLGCESVDAPVSGGDVGAREHRLSIMAGGHPAAFERAIPFFRLMGSSWILEGAPGAGQHTKMANQITIAGTMGGVCEALLYAKKAGLDPSMMVSTIAKGAAGCWTLDNLAPRIINGNYDPGFFIDHFVKDMGIALDEARRMGLALPCLSLVNQLYIAMQGHGDGKMGTQALVLALDRLSGCGCFESQSRDTEG